MSERFICNERRCGWIGTRDKLVTIDVPMNGELLVCPECQTVESTIVAACYFDGCKREASSGNPTKDGGYLWACHEHSKLIEEPE